MSYSFLNPVVDAKIWSPIDGEIDLSIFGGEEAIPYIQSVEIKTGLSFLSEISLELSPTYDEAMRLLNETGWFRLGNQLGVRWGYNDGQPGHITDWIYGMMLLPDLDIGEEVRLTIKANSFGVRSDMEDSFKSWSKPDAPVSLFDVIVEIGQKYGFEVMFHDGKTLAPLMASSPFASIEILLEPRPDMIQGGLTDMQFLYRRMKECGLEMSLIGSKLVIFMEPSESQPAAEFHMYGKIDPEKNIFPMLSFAPESLGPLFLPHSSYAAVISGWNNSPLDMIEVVELSGSSSGGTDPSNANFYSGEQALETPGVDGPANPSTGVKSNVAKVQSQDLGKRVPLPIPETFVKEQATGILQGLMDDNADDFGIAVKIGAMALPTLFPNQIVRARGVSNFFSTDYKVREITVSISSSDATMELDCCAKGIAPDLCIWSDVVNLSAQGETQPGDGGEDTSADSEAGE
jgi:hypothetical protein